MIWPDAAEIKIEAEAKAGALLADMDKHPGGRPSENRSHDETSLSDLGIDKNQSHRWQRIAKVEPVSVVQPSDRLGEGSQKNIHAIPHFKGIRHITAGAQLYQYRRYAGTLHSE